MASIKITLSDSEFRDLKASAMRDGLRFSVFAGQMYRRGFTLHQNTGRIMATLIPDKMPISAKEKPKGKAGIPLKPPQKQKRK